MNKQAGEVTLSVSGEDGILEEEEASSEGSVSSRSEGCDDDEEGPSNPPKKPASYNAMMTRTPSGKWEPHRRWSASYLDGTKGTFMAVNCFPFY